MRYRVNSHQQQHATTGEQTREAVGGDVVRKTLFLATDGALGADGSGDLLTRRITQHDDKIDPTAQG